MVFLCLFSIFSHIFPMSEVRHAGLSGTIRNHFLSAGQHVPFGSRSGRRRRKRPCLNDEGVVAQTAMEHETSNLEAYWRSTVETYQYFFNKLMLAGNWCLCELVSGTFHNSQHLTTSSWRDRSPRSAAKCQIS